MIWASGEPYPMASVPPTQDPVLSDSGELAQGVGRLIGGGRSWRGAGELPVRPCQPSLRAITRNTS